MTTMAFDDGATFCDGAGWLRRCIRRFYDCAARPRFVEGLRVNSLDASGYGLERRYRWGGERGPVQVNPRHVLTARPCAMDGEPGYLLCRRRTPVAWVPAASWLEATGR